MGVWGHDWQLGGRPAVGGNAYTCRGAMPYGFVNTPWRHVERHCPASLPPSSPQVMLDALLPHADTEAAAADEPVCVFSEVGIVAPRGRFEVEMHLGYLQLGGQVRGRREEGGQGREEGGRMGGRGRRGEEGGGRREGGKRRGGGGEGGGRRGEGKMSAGLGSEIGVACVGRAWECWEDGGGVCKVGTEAVERWRGCGQKGSSNGGGVGGDMRRGQEVSGALGCEVFCAAKREQGSTSFVAGEAARAFSTFKQGVQAGCRGPREGIVAHTAPQMRPRYPITIPIPPPLTTLQSQDFKVRYASIQRIFILPKHNTPHTLVVISLDPPIRKGQVRVAGKE